MDNELASQKRTRKTVPEKTKQEELDNLLVDIKERKNALDNSIKDIIVESFTLACKDQVLLKDADLKIVHGRKYGLVAPNGAGKFFFPTKKKPPIIDRTTKKR